MVDTEAVREHLLTERRATVEGVLACADRVDDDWDGDGTTDRERVVEPFESVLRASGLFESFPALLAECVDRAGADLSARPVAGPPYVVVTSVGVLLRATLPTGRLVVTLRAFAVDRSEEGSGGRSGERPRYVRGPTTPEDAVSVDLRAR
jgi:hypothetical protein